MTCAGAGDVFLASFSSAGAHRWSQHFGGTAFDGGAAIARDPDDNLYLTGRFSFDASFGGNELSSAGSTDVFIASFDSDGNHRWSQRYGDAQTQAGRGLAVSDVGTVVITGEFTGEIDFGAGTQSSPGIPDTFLASLVQP